MHSNENAPMTGGRTRRGMSRVLAAVCVLLVMSVLLLILSIFQSRRPASSLRQNGFLPPDGRDTFFAAAGNGLAAADHDEIRLFSSGGKCAASVPVQFEQPMCAAGAAVSVYYDNGVPGLYALYPDGNDEYTDTDGAVVFADVNETGLVTVILDKSGTMGVVMVFDTDLTPLFRWDAATAFPVCARTDKNDLLCVNCASREGGSLRFFRIDASQEQSRFDLENELILDVGFLSDRSLAAVTEKRILFVNTAGELIASQSFEGSHLDAFSLKGDFAAVSTVSGSAGGSGVLTTFDAQGQILDSLSAPRHADALCVCGDQLLVLYTGEESTLYKSDLSEVVSYQPEEGVKQIFLTPNGTAYYAGPGGVTQIVFGR